MKALTQDLLTRSRDLLTQYLDGLEDPDEALHADTGDVARLLGEIDAALRTDLPRIPFADVPLFATFEWGDIKAPEWRRSYKKISDLVARRTDNGRNIWPSGDQICVVVSADGK